VGHAVLARSDDARSKDGGQQVEPSHFGGSRLCCNLEEAWRVMPTPRSISHAHRQMQPHSQAKHARDCGEAGKRTPTHCALNALSRAHVNLTEQKPYLGQHNTLDVYVRVQEGFRELRHIPPGPLLRHINEQLAEFYMHGIEVLDNPIVGPSARITIFPKCILRICDFPGARV